MRKKIIAYISIIIVLTALICTALTPMALSAETSRHTDVMSDLIADETFDLSDYPSIAKDYTLEVIQIAEGSDKSLFVYVYNPSSDRVATKLRMSVMLGKDYAPKDYVLKEMSHKGTLSKYLVEGFKVSAESKRYYDLISIYRTWDSSIGDKESGNDNVISEVVYKVGKNYTVRDTADGGIDYSCNDIEVIEITDKYSGSIRYNDGEFFLTQKKCDSWFVAFDTDKRIDTLKEADVSFVSEKITYRGNNSQYVEDVEKTEHPSITVRASDVVSNDADGLFGKKYEWNRIEKVSDFIAKEDLTDDCKKNLEGKKWVLRFYESDYVHVQSAYSFSGEKTKVTEVTILRLNFETLGESYNLGVIDNYQSPDDKNDNNNDNELKNPIDDIKDWWDRLMDWWNNAVSSIKIALSVVGILCAVAVVCFVLSIVFRLIESILNLFRKKRK